MNDFKSEGANKAMVLLTRMFTVEMGFMGSPGKDTDVLASAFHRDVVVHIPASLPYSGDWHGLDGLGKLFSRMHDVWSAMTVEDMTATIDGETLFMSGTLVATARRSGREICQPFAQTLKLEDGLVIEGIPFYSDTARIVAAFEAEPGHGVLPRHNTY